MAARNKLAPASGLASCLHTDSHSRRLSFAAQASLLFLLRADSIPVAALLLLLLLLQKQKQSCRELALAQRTETLRRERQPVANGQRSFRGFCCTAYRVALLIHLRGLGRMKVDKPRRGKSWLQLLAPPTSRSTPLPGLEEPSWQSSEIPLISRHYNTMQCSLPMEISGDAHCHRDHTREGQS